MQNLAVMSMLLLLAIAVVGICAGSYAAVSAMHLFDPAPASVLGAMAAGAASFGIGTVALGSAAVVAAVLSAAQRRISGAA